MKEKFRILLVSLLTVQMVSCASTTQINSTPSGAKLYIDGAYVGTTPYTYSDTKIVGTATQIKLSKDGCRDANITMHRSEKFEVGPCIGGVLVLVPFLWVMGYNPQRTYALECQNTSHKDRDISPLLTELDRNNSQVNQTYNRVTCHI